MVIAMGAPAGEYSTCTQTHAHATTQQHISDPEHNTRPNTVCPVLTPQTQQHHAAPPTMTMTYRYNFSSGENGECGVACVGSRANVLTGKHKPRLASRQRTRVRHGTVQHILMIYKSTTGHTAATEPEEIRSQSTIPARWHSEVANGQLFHTETRTRVPIAVELTAQTHRYSNGTSAETSETLPMMWGDDWKG